eukprot:10858584-Alexandrium_andersonii.AAC.1
MRWCSMSVQQELVPPKPPALSCERPTSDWEYIPLEFHRRLHPVLHTEATVSWQRRARQDVN